MDNEEEEEKSGGVFNDHFNFTHTEDNTPKKKTPAYFIPIGIILTLVIAATMSAMSNIWVSLIGFALMFIIWNKILDE